jgi:type II pantothenate kinase
MTPSADKELAIMDTSEDRPLRRRPRTMTSTEEIDSTITRPGSVKINVKGAFIVDPDASTPAPTNGSANGYTNGRHSPSHHETSDIRLPNHTAVVSHIAVDVSTALTFHLSLPPSVANEIRGADWRFPH